MDRDPNHRLTQSVEQQSLIDRLADETSSMSLGSHPASATEVVDVSDRSSSTSSELAKSKPEILTTREVLPTVTGIEKSPKDIEKRKSEILEKQEDIWSNLKGVGTQKLPDDIWMPSEGKDESQLIDKDEKMSTTLDAIVPDVACQQDAVTNSSVQPQPDAEVADLSVGHQLKQIMWRNKTMQVVTQNENGPCPLIAIANVLLLRGTITLPTTKSVTAHQLIQHVGGAILNNYPKNLDSARMLDYERNITDAMNILPHLLTGLDVNVIFTGVKKFEYTPECIIFDLLNITLYHGWVLDPQDESTVSAIGSLGYNQLVERIILNKCSDRTELVTEALIAEQFLEGTASQLTYFGLCELNETLGVNELAVLFRNNHFSTIFKKRAANNDTANSLDAEPVTNELFQLVTDQGFLLEPSVVWESMVNIEGDGMFVDSNFTVAPYKSSTNFVIAPPEVTRESQIDQDYMLALSLNEEMKTQGDKEPDWEEAKYIVEAPNKSNTNAQYVQQARNEERRVSIAKEADEQPTVVHEQSDSPSHQKSPPRQGSKSPSSHGSKSSIQSGSKSPTQGDSKSCTQPQPTTPAKQAKAETPLPSRSQSPDSSLANEEPQSKKSRCSIQ